MEHTPQPATPRPRPWGLEPYPEYLEVARAPIPEFEDAEDPIEAREEWIGALSLAEGRDALPLINYGSPTIVTLESRGMVYVLQHPDTFKIDE